MASLNQCNFIGNLTREVELKYTPKGTAIAELGMALNHVYTTDSGEKREEVTFIDITAWGRTAEIACEYLHKGDVAYFECRAQLDQWEDKQTGAKRSKIKFIAQRLILMPNKAGGKAQSPDDSAARQKQKSVKTPDQDVNLDDDGFPQ